MTSRSSDGRCGRLGKRCDTRYASGDLTGAAQAFERVALRHDSAAAWHNLAVARQRLGQREAALVAADRALARAQAVEPQWLDAARALRDPAVK